MKNQNVICLIDNTTHDSVEHLHLYLRTLKVTQEFYYTNYVPRKDLFTGELIKFKSLDFYLSADFNSKDNMREWILKNPEKAKIWSLELLEKRIKNKELKYSPTQVELSSLCSPTMHYYNRIGEYYSICRSFGLIPRFRNNPLVFRPLNNKVAIIEDTREKNPLFFENRQVISAKLDVGDYGLEEKYSRDVYIERKSVSDFAQTLTKGYSRFIRELKRAEDKKYYVVMLVESPLEVVLSFDKLHEMRYTKVNPPHVFKNLRELLNKFINFQVLFVDDRKMAANAVIKIFELGDQISEVDLQYRFEKGELL
jgi:hypothetical protein